MKKVVFYELNEVPLKVFDYYCDAFPNSALNMLRRRSAVFETYAEDTGHLSPWVTWPTLHRGVLNDVHEISDFGQDLTHVNKEMPPIWDLLAKNSVKVGMFGSLHTYPLPEDLSRYAFYVPDTFAAGPECFPTRYEAFQRFNLAMAGQNAAHVNHGIALKEAGKFLAAAPRLGLRARTVSKIGRQLISERMNKNRVVRRRTSQTQIAFDFFYKALWRDMPDASFFFTNHVASSLHRYWPALFPEDYKDLRYGSGWLADWKGEIPFTLHEASEQIGLLMAFADRNPGYKLVVLTSMGQSAVEGKERIMRKVVITGLPRLMQAIGMQQEDWQKRPAMVPQYNVYVAPAKRNVFMQKIGALSINGQGLRVDHLGDGIFRLEFRLENQVGIKVTFEGSNVDPARFGIVNLDLQDAAGANAYHIPEGTMAVYDPGNPAGNYRCRISTLDVAPAVLRNFGIDPPGYMQSGFSL
jgi:hypothetical protein